MGGPGQEVPEVVKPLSNHARSLTGRLYRRLNLGQRLLGESGLDLAVVQELGQCGEAAAIPHLAPALLLATRRERVACAQAIAPLLSRASAKDFVLLDEAMRGSWVFADRYGERWRRLDPRELARWVGQGEAGSLLLRMASFHSNGFIREEALRHLTRTVDGSELPYLLLRLNDWVSQVRQAAQQAVGERIKPEYIEHFVQSLALVIRLERTERADHRLIEEISGLLTSPAARPALIAAMRHHSARIRRASYRFLVAGEPAGLVQVLLAGLLVPDPLIRLWSLRKAAATLERDQLLTVVHTLCADPSAAIRCEALSVLATEFPDRAAERLHFALLDPSPSVRGTARFPVRKSERLDFAQFYRDSLEATAPGRLAASISGLVETGVSTDVERLVPHLSNPSVAVRRAATWGVLKLGGEPYLHLVLERVLDAAPGVSLAATRALQPYAGHLGGTALWTRFATSGLTHVRRNLLCLMVSLPKWDSICYLVQAAGDADEVISSLTLEYIQRWDARYNKGHTVPSSAQVSRLRVALSQWGPNLGPNERALLEFAVRSFSAR